MAKAIRHKNRGESPGFFAIQNQQKSFTFSVTFVEKIVRQQKKVGIYTMLC